MVLRTTFVPFQITSSVHLEGKSKMHFTPRHHFARYPQHRNIIKSIVHFYSENVCGGGGGTQHHPVGFSTSDQYHIVLIKSLFWNFLINDNLF